ncbi:RCC1 and BTB domain-containing protein 2-like [Cimex lectularius]|uniref:BTB domain-containing protein n=1 Tax=Cimex lectularius TaxID=79782 RepID=A0A8I6SBJ7_CIMLE|nr:RCC1 and BTB domain-containing protein 2-like [Cimex lectularius]
MDTQGVYFSVDVLKFWRAILKKKAVRVCARRPSIAFRAYSYVEMPCVYSPVDFSLWNVFSKVSKSLLERVVLLHVFGERGSSAIFVTEDDVVYGIGSNIRAIDAFKLFSIKPDMFGFLGIGQTVHTSTPVEIRELSRNRIICFSSGLDHTLGLSSTGDLWVWGKNDLHQLGNFHTGTINRPFLKFKNQIKSIATGDNYSLVLLNNGMVMHWGTLKTEKEVIAIPTVLNFPEYRTSVGTTVLQIASGCNHAAALGINGEVYIWGDNSEGQLGHGFGKGFYDIPVLFTTEDLRVETIGCGSTATFVLYDNGDLGSLGCVGDLCKFKSQVKDFTVTNREQILCVQTVDGFHYFTVISSDKMFSVRPVSVKGKNWQNVFGGKCTPQFIRQRYKTVEILPPMPKRDIGNKLYDNKDMSDLTILLRDGEVYVHKLIMKTFCQHFQRMISDDIDTIDIQVYNPNSYRAFLKYIYTGSIPPLDVIELVELYGIAFSYEEDELKNIARHLFKTQLSNENVLVANEAAKGSGWDELAEICTEYASLQLDRTGLEGREELAVSLGKILLTVEGVATTYNFAQESNLNNLKELCCQFASENWDRVVLSKSFELLTPQTRCDFMKDSAKIKTQSDLFT